MPIAISVDPVEPNHALKEKTYGALKKAISQMDIYSTDEEFRLDERHLSEELGVSRTPVREALCRLEQEGLIRMIPRRGAFVVRKTKQEIIEMVLVWAALEGMAARLATTRASDEQIASLRMMFATYENTDHKPQARIDEYSETNIRFHQTLLGLGGCELIDSITANFFIHMRAIRARTIGDADRASRSIIDHMHIIESLERRDAETTERLVRDHTLKLASHIEQYASYLD